MAKRKTKKLDYISLEPQYGAMYHLVLDRPTDADESVRYVSDDDKPMYATVQGNPIFFNWDKEFRVALDYTIIYPKIYVKESEPYTLRTKLERNYIQ